MGYYTKCFFKCRLNNVPEGIVNAFQSAQKMEGWTDHGNGSYTAAGDQLAKFKNDYYSHEFFKCERWRIMLSREVFKSTKKGYYSLKIDTEINHGYHEIQEFINLIEPYIIGRKRRQYIGYYRPEDGDNTYVFMFRDLYNPSEKILKQFSSRELYELRKGRRSQLKLDQK